MQRFYVIDIYFFCGDSVLNNEFLRYLGLNIHHILDVYIYY